MPDNTSNSGLNQVLGNVPSATSVVGENASIESTRARTIAINENTVAIERNIKAQEKLSQTALDSSRQMTSALEQHAQAVKSNADIIGKGNRAIGDSYAESAKRITQSLKELQREDFWGKIQQGIQKVVGVADSINKTLVELNKTVLDTTNSMGVMASSTGAILDGQVKLGGQLKNVNLSYREMNDAIGKISLSGRITNEEARRLFTSLTAVGVSARDVSDIFTKTDGVLGLINSGFLKAEDASSLAQDAITGMGKSAQVAEQQMMRIVTTTSKLNESFGKGTFSTQQMVKGVLSLQQSLRFIETDLERLPTYLASFAGAAKKYQDLTKGKGISQEAAIELGKQQMGAVASMDIARATFLGQKAGMGGGLLAGERFLRLDPADRVSKMNKVLLKESGMEAISDEELERVEKTDPVRASMLAEKRALQVNLLKVGTPGLDDQRGRKLLNVISAGGGKAEMEKVLKTDEQQYKEDLKKYLENSVKTNENQTTTIKEWYEKWKEYILGKAQAATGGWANIAASITSAAGQIGLFALGLRGLGLGKAAGKGVSWAGKMLSGGTAARTTAAISTLSKTFPKTASALSSTANVLAKAIPGLSKVAPLATKAAPAMKFLPGVGLAASGAYEIYHASSGNQGAGLFGKKNRSAWSAGGMADDALIMAAGTTYGGPIGTAATGLALAGIRAYGAQVARGQAKESLREGVDIAGAVYGKSGSDKFKDFAKSHADTYKDIAESNMGGWWGRDKTFKETYGGASSEQKKAMDDAFKAYIDTAKAGDTNEAKRYLGQIRSFISTETKTEDALNLWMKQNRPDLGTLDKNTSIDDMTRILGARENSAEANLTDEQKRDVEKMRKIQSQEDLDKIIKERKEKEEAAKKQPEVNLTASTYLDGAVIARAVAKHLLSNGIFTPGNNANLAGVS